MTKKWSELYERIPAGRRARIEERVAQDLSDMRLAELRRARELTQQQIAGNLNVNQAWVSKIERQTDMYLSTLRSYVEAMGGKLEIVARFDDATVRVNQFEDSRQEPEGSFPHAEGSSPDTRANTRDSTTARVSVWTSQPSENRAIDYGELRDMIWHAGGSNTTTRSSTPSPDTNPKTSRAA